MSCFFLQIFNPYPKLISYHRFQVDTFRYVSLLHYIGIFNAFNLVFCYFSTLSIFLCFSLTGSLISLCIRILLIGQKKGFRISYNLSFTFIIIDTHLSTWSRNLFSTRLIMKIEAFNILSTEVVLDWWSSYRLSTGLDFEPVFGIYEQYIFWVLVQNYFLPYFFKKSNFCIKKKYEFCMSQKMA